MKDIEKRIELLKEEIKLAKELLELHKKAEKYYQPIQPIHPVHPICPYNPPWITWTDDTTGKTKWVDLSDYQIDVHVLTPEPS